MRWTKNLREENAPSDWRGEGFCPWGLPAFRADRVRFGTVQGGLFSANHAAPRFLIVTSLPTTRWLIPFPMARVERGSVHFDALHPADLARMTWPILLPFPAADPRRPGSW